MSSMESQAASTVDDDYANPRGGNNDIVPVEKTTDTVPTGVNQDGSEDSDEQLRKLTHHCPITHHSSTHFIHYY